MLNTESSSLFIYYFFIYMDFLLLFYSKPRDQDKLFSQNCHFSPFSCTCGSSTCSIEQKLPFMTLWVVTTAVIEWPPILWTVKPIPTGNLAALYLCIKGSFVAMPHYGTDSATEQRQCRNVYINHSVLHYFTTYLSLSTGIHHPDSLFHPDTLIEIYQSSIFNYLEPKVWEWSL